MSGSASLETLLASQSGADAAGKVVVVTGAGRGIGLQAARAFSRLGARVVIAEISDEGAQAEALIQSEGGTARFIRTDVADPASVQSMHAQAAAVFGPADILVNNAMLCPVCPVEEMDTTLWDRVMAVNLRGTFLVSRAFLPDMLARGSGVLVSMISAEAMPGLSAYIASKQGITGFSQSLALECGERGVQVIAFAPGLVDTPGIRAVAGDLAPRLGLTREQFLGMSLHSAYEGMMPAEHAGVATALLALRLAHEYHGQSVTGYEVLERLGLLPSAGSAPVAAPGSAPQPRPSQTADLGRLARELAGAVAETGKEFEKLPVFVRPIARQGFKNKAGQSLDDWQRSLLALAEPAPGAPSPAGLAERLDKLIVYFRGVPAETGRFTRDAALLRQVEETCERRIALIEEIQKRLDN